MSIRLPLKATLTKTNHDEVGAGSAAGVVTTAFTIPQDTDNIVVKFQACTVGGGVSALLQTTDDGGTTYYDVARSSIVSNTAVAGLAEWMSIPVIGFGFRTGEVTASTVATGSVVSKGSVLTTIGNAQTSTLAQKAYSGMPILSQQARIALILTGDLTTSSITTTVYVNSQSATA